MSAVVALHDGDGLGKPNLALMKIAAYYRARGFVIEWFNPLLHSDERRAARGALMVFSSKVFTFTPEDPYLPSWAIRGGTGYRFGEGRLSDRIRYGDDLPVLIEHARPDYTLYGIKHGLGFLTRGCPNSCTWCVVPQKEGPIRRHMDIEELLNPLSKDVVLYDNNILACERHGLRQIMKAVRLGLRIDCNQGLDARLIDAGTARILSRVRWLKPVRLACDRKEQMPLVEAAVHHLRAANVTPRDYSCYVLVNDVADAHERVKFLLDLGVDPFAQPYRDWQGTPPTQKQRDFANWVNRHYCKVVPWTEFRPRKNMEAA